MRYDNRFQVSNSDLHKSVRGMVTPLATPLLDADTLDREGLEKLLEHIIAGGVSGVFLLGTTGESASLSYRLRAELIRSACSLVRGRAAVLIGISDTSYPESVRLANIARESGADAAVVAPPYYFMYSQDDLLRYTELVAHAARLPLFLYNIPSLTKMSFETDTVRRAADIPGVAGVKDSTFDLDYLKRIVSDLGQRDDFSILIGPETMLLEGLQLGAQGGVSGGSNLNPALLADVVKAFQAGDLERAAALQQRVTSVDDTLYTVGDPATGYLRGLKCALSLIGIGTGYCAPPFSPFTAEEIREVRTRMESLGLLQ